MEHNQTRSQKTGYPSVQHPSRETFYRIKDGLLLLEQLKSMPDILSVSKLKHDLITSLGISNDEDYSSQRERQMKDLVDQSDEMMKIKSKLNAEICVLQDKLNSLRTEVAAVRAEIDIDSFEHVKRIKFPFYTIQVLW